ncbi:MAG: hypothetical protein ACRD2P_07410 [Terriglobia bacterium]
MLNNRRGLTGFVLIVALTLPLAAAPRKKNKVHDAKEKTAESAPGAVLWRYPTDIASRNLFYGPGGKQHAPGATFIFVSEDFSGSNPKYEVRDLAGNKWKIKLGPEARPEIAATRLVWAVGYFTNEDYYIPEVQVQNLPSHVKRGQKWIGPGGIMRDVRLKRYPKGEKKLGDWQWKHNPFIGAQPFNGLRILMAVINSWDLKDDNNAVYQEARPGRPNLPSRIYMVKDLGSSFGTTGQSWTDAKSKGNLKSYRRSRFITRETPGYVDFAVPTRPSLDYLIVLPQFMTDLRSHWIGKHIPRADAKWLGQLLAQLSPSQIGDAFRAAGYSPQQAAGFTQVIEVRIRDLNQLGPEN